MQRKYSAFKTPLVLSIFIVSLIFINLLFCIKVEAASFSTGADVSWLPQMEAKGYKFYDDNGVQKDCLQILKEHGINSIRLRVWVNPSDDPYSGHCSKAETIALAKRCANMGFRIMIDFHYSDSWADPGKQYKPAAWNSHGISQLLTDVYDHTYDVLNTLKSNGVTPEWVQIGNETNNGMLWDDGKASVNMKNFAQLVSRGYDAVKAVFPQTKVIVHISNGYDNSLFRWIFDGLKNNGGKYDVIGMSLYPESNNWSTISSQCLTNMNDMVSRYGKEVMICEVGMDNNAASACKSLISDLIKKVGSLSGGKGLGVFYWEPQCYNWAGYGKGAWSTNGRPTIAMDAFLEANVGVPTSASTATPTSTQTPTSISTPTPTPTANPTATPSVSARSVSGYIKGAGFMVELEGTQYLALSDSKGFFSVNDIPSALTEFTLNIFKPGFLSREIYIKMPKDRYSISISESAAPLVLIEGDMNNNKVINMEDVIIIAKVFSLTASHPQYNAAADFNNDGIINMSDIIMLAKNFGRTSADYPIVNIDL
ncbi:MAG TPA: glycosyl hydrolase 53 family protein [Pseudobacteroides sp.]|uniref:glycosyl hydrolase 53 family protein n=1 Tax=Pseudobacteroides sp. TaxID=1968840 RepID=UPI002F948043